MDTVKACPGHSKADAWINVFQVSNLNNFNVGQINRMHEILREPEPSNIHNAFSGQ